MPSKYVKFRGKAHFVKPWDSQIDREYEDPSNPKDRGGNWNGGVIVDDAALKVFNAIGGKGEPKEHEDGHLLTFRRYEKLGNGQPLRTRNVAVRGVEANTPIGNGSDITMIVEVYDTAYRGKPIVGTRWAGIDVHELVEYVKPERPMDEEVPF